MKIINLKTEGLVQPLGIDCERPAFSWAFEGENYTQKTYRIRVASEIALLPTPDVWDSGVVCSDESLHILYAGKKLENLKAYYWQVEADGVLSDIACFETAFIGGEMPYADWIGMPFAHEGCTDLVRLDFEIDKPIKRARFYCAALGTSVCYCNGEKISCGFGAGALSVWHKCVYYNVYPLENLRMGNNALCVELGYGFYGAKKMKGLVHFQFEDGTSSCHATISGRLWNITQGFCLRNSLYNGETCDGRKSRDILSPNYTVSTNEFCAAYCVDMPSGALKSCSVPPMQEVGRTVLQWRKVAENTYFVDANVNATGYLDITVKGEAGARVCIRYAELEKDGRISTGNLRTAENRDEYICGGMGEERYAPQFTYHGFRYAEITLTGNVEILRMDGVQIRSGIAQSGQFYCSDKTVNALHEIATRTEGNNLNGTFTDCPQRDERLAWLNDMASRIFEAVCNFDNSVYLPQFVDMISHSQRADGSIGDTVPFVVGSAVADPVSAYPLLGWIAYRHYGDKRVLQRNYDGFCRWMEKLQTMLKNGVIEWGLYGDWCPAKPFAREDCDTKSALVPLGFTSTLSYLWNLKMVRNIAQELGLDADREKWDNLLTAGKAAFVSRYCDMPNKTVCDNAQTACAFYMTVFAEDKEMCAYLAKVCAGDIAARGYHMTCGNIGYRHLFYRLAEYGYIDTLVKLLVNPEYPGWGYMLQNGATSVWERWEADVATDMHSFNHPMFGAYDGFLYNYLAGIRTEECTNAFKNIVIAPCFAKQLDYVDCSFQTVRGEISVSWKRTGKGISVRVKTPANTRLCFRAKGVISYMGGVYTDEITLSNGTFAFIVEE